jgi:hypothetical protein
MRKLFLSLCLLLSLCVTGCTQQQSHEPQIKATVKHYLKSVQNGDYDKALTYCTTKVSDQVALNMVSSSIKKSLKNLGVEESSNDLTKTFTENVAKKFIQSYKIKAINEESDSSTVIVTIKGIDIDSLSFDSIDSELETMLDQYIQDNSESLASLFNEKGQEELTSTLTNDFVKVIFDKINETVDNSETKDQKLKFTLNNKYKITKIQFLKSKANKK